MQKYWLKAPNLVPKYTILGLITFFVAVMVPIAAYAYIGPGAGLSIVGSVLAFLAAIVIAVFGFLWFPIKRLMRRRKEGKAQKIADEQPGKHKPDSPEAMGTREESDG